MNAEYKRGWMASSKLLIALALATLGWLWGRGFPGVMRLWIPLIIAITCMASEIIQKKKFELLTFGMYVSMVAIAYGIMCAFAYGSSSFLRGLGVIPQRIIVGFMWGLPYIIVAIRNSSKKIWMLFVVHMILVTSRMGLIGGLDLLSAPEQEALTRGIIAVLPPFMVRWE